MLPKLRNRIVKTARHWGRKGGKMRTKQLNNKKSHNPVPRNRSNSRKSLFCRGLRSTPSCPDSLVSRETLITHCGKSTYNGQIAHILPSPSSTFCHNFAEMMNIPHPDLGIHRDPKPVPLCDRQHRHLGLISDLQLRQYRTRKKICSFRVVSRKGSSICRLWD
jgi:hypothetical protein